MHRLTNSCHPVLHVASVSSKPLLSKELTHRRKKENEIDRMHKDLNTIEQHLKYCKRANAMATLLVPWPT